MRTFITVTALAAAAATGCDDNGTPAELDRARVLAVRISPPHLGPEETAPVMVLVGTSDGTVSEVAPEGIEVVGAPPGSPASGMVGRGADGWAIACPDPEVLAQLRQDLDLGEEDPIPIALAVEVEVEGALLTATKYVYLGSTGDNPALAGISLDGGREEDGVLVLQVGAEVSIAAEGAAGDTELSFAWFTSAGDIDLYLSEEATLTPQEPGDGQLALVVRDERGGVTWTWRDVRAE
ncbi:MAG TPA: hypothetical protein VFU21_20185 [Kofleriaceae bacterium]|nr:hypothetical protein [Kofleriaceae bacterium]